MEREQSIRKHLEKPDADPLSYGYNASPYFVLPQALRSRISWLRLCTLVPGYQQANTPAASMSMRSFRGQGLSYCED